MQCISITIGPFKCYSEPLQSLCTNEIFSPRDGDWIIGSTLGQETSTYGEIHVYDSDPKDKTRVLRPNFKM